MKKLFAISLAALMAMSVMTACGGSGDGDITTAAGDTTAAVGGADAPDESLQKIMDKGTFVLGLDDSFPPMGFRDENNEIVGFDIDCAKEVCARLGVELKLQPIAWEAKEMELNSGNIDCIWNGMSVSAEREEAMNLSEPYLRNEMVFVVTNGSSVNTIADLSGKNVAVQNGSTAQEILEEAEEAKTFASTIGYDDNVTALMDLEVGGVDAVFVDSIVAEYLITANNKDCRILEEGLYSEEYAIGFRKNDAELRNKVQQILSEMKADGKLGEISTKWFGEDSTIVK